jgi:L-threo-3-deoxy-hexylosonate aldolase
MTFFDPVTEELDLPTIRRHAVRLAKDGVVGLVTMGSTGEAVHLNREEKRLVTQVTRGALDEAGFGDVPVIVGASEQSIKGTIEMCREAAAAGGEYVLLMPPSYYRSAMTEDALYDYYIVVSDGSPLPVILYNWPLAVSGIDMDSDFIIRVSQHPNVVGTKFTCGNTGKLTRVAHAVNALTPHSRGSGYVALGGFTDFILQTLVSGGSGVIAGTANIMPKACVHVFNLYAQGEIDKAMQVQKILSQGDWVINKAMLQGHKSASQQYFGYGGYPRRPLQRMSEEKARELGEMLKEVMELEMSL